MDTYSRRHALAATLGSGLILTLPAPAAEQEIEVSPSEDLMREHGVLKRVLLIYRECMSRLDQKKDFPPEALSGPANMIRHFIEDYHEKLEENYLFPRFRKAKLLVDLVDTLEKQHEAGRKVTARILQLATPAGLKDSGQRATLRQCLYEFVRMYEPQAREDTVLFPAIRKIVSPHEYDSLGEEFEKKEHQLFGGDGFEMNVDKVAGYEKTLGIYELAQFTPKV